MSNNSNINLYRAGQQYAKRLRNLRAGGISPRAAELQIAKNHRTEAEQVRTAVEFAAAVDLIASNCGRVAKQLLLADVSRLPVQTVMQISRTHAERQQFALVQAEAGRNPFGKPSSGVPPYDTHGYSEVLSRLARNAGLLDHVASGLLNTQRVDWPDDDCLRKCSESIEKISSDCRKMTNLMKRSGGKIREKKGCPPWEVREARKGFNTSSTYRQIRSVQGMAEKSLRDLPRLLKESPPTHEEADAVLKALANLRISADRLASVVRTRSHNMRTGPAAVPGTYIVFYYLARPAKRLRIGALGTFDFPAGYFGYVGTAFGGGGVKKRTERHRTRISNDRWNIDYLKRRCKPVALWWTHDRAKVEFQWAEILGSMPGRSFPAPGFGAADNDGAEAHLVRFAKMPSFAVFRRRVEDAMTGHAPIHRMRIRGWKGR
jgi:Uri superfamily endonuclease